MQCNTISDVVMVYFRTEMNQILFLFLFLPNRISLVTYFFFV